ncbi:hypothetical protein [Prevotella multiformis]|nr:hypothetical protein [Prevotella multiformis]
MRVLSGDKSGKIITALSPLVIAHYRLSPPIIAYSLLSPPIIL